MRAAVVGANWGAVHVAALREAGVEVVALAGRDAGRTRLRADTMGIRHALTDLGALSDLQLDLISVATPAPTHLQVISALPATIPVLCEKPAVGLSAAGPLPPTRTAPVLVNYAFAALDGAVWAAAQLAGAGPLAGARVISSYDLPGAGAPVAMFLELVSHPWSWLVKLLGPPGPPTATSQGAHRCGFTASCGPVPVELACVHQPGLAGIRHEVELRGEHATLGLVGQYQQGRDWYFPAPRLLAPSSSSPRAVGPAQAGPGDPWFRANARAIRAAVSALTGGWCAPYLFDWDSALALDRVAQAGLRAAGPQD